MDEKNKLSEKDIKVLMALEEVPLATFDELAILTGYPKSSVFNIYDSLIQETEDQKSIFAVYALPNLRNLGMEIIDVLVEAPHYDQYKFLRELCLEHPYTAYEARTYGNINGMLIQFRIPIGTKNLIEDLFQRIVNQGHIQKFYIYSFSSTHIYTTTKVKYWDHSALHWDFSWKSWFSLDNLSWNEPKIRSSKESTKKKSESSALKWLKRTDLEIMNEIMKNSRKKRVEYMKLLKKNKKIVFTRQTFSRRLKKLTEDCILGYRLMIRPHILDLHNPTLLIGKAPATFIKNLSQQLHLHPIPFTSTFKHNQNTFFWYIHLPSSHLSDLLFELNPYLDDLQLNIIDHPRSRIFYFYTGAYNEKENRWNESRSFMVDDVLTYMQTWLKKDDPRSF